MKPLLILLLSLFIILNCEAQSKQAYILYSSTGKRVSYQKMIKVLVKHDIVLIGEYHNNPISHWMELEITKDCQQSRQLVLGAEMMEQDNQNALDLYLQGIIDSKGFDSMARLWKNYATDYAPLVDFAKDQNIKFAATNIPRIYASMVSKGGFEALDTVSAASKKWMAPLPILFDPELPCYKNMLTMMAGHGTADMLKAQAIKDATMAFFVVQYFEPGKLFIHYNGSYHSDNHEGIVWYLKQSRPELKVVTVSTVSQKDIGTLSEENKQVADFIICVDEDMTSTY